VNLKEKIGRVSDRQLAVLVTELLLVLLGLFLLGRFEAVVASPRHGEQHPPIPMHEFEATPSAVPATSSVHAGFNACGFSPLLPARDSLDGRYHLEAVLPTAEPPSFTALMAVAGDAAGQQRQRDAEVALIVACRVAERTQGARSVDVASAQAKLAQVYLAFARSATSGAGDAIHRAHDLMVQSLAGYTAILGVQSSRTQVAAQKLSQFEAAQAQGVDPAMSPQELDAAIAASTVMGSAPISIDAICSANPAAPPCNDPELLQADADLARLRLQAAAVTRDRQGFEMRLRTAQASRAACVDVACLRRWYDHRRGELLKEF
jgi:uncharacterized protein